MREKSTPRNSPARSAAANKTGDRANNSFVSTPQSGASCPMASISTWPG
ncbi:hypothetical protein [Acidovorax sp. NCPPB 4044]|nr:hypothetical protein [Acidovorax sp. NCPPB 4044]MDA8519592.1 hypothetical protein [Acidovorax sp. NCPPB 4044]